MKPGPTHDFPEGKLNPTDEGGLNIAISRRDGVIRIDFGKEVAWIAMNSKLAKDIAIVLMKHAVALEDEEDEEEDN